MISWPASNKSLDDTAPQAYALRLMSDNNSHNRQPQARIVGLISAGGNGSRLDMGPKGLLQLQGRTLVEIAIEQLHRAGVETILVGVPAEALPAFQAAIGRQAKALPGGGNRQETITRLLAEANVADDEYCLVHDVIRPLASQRVYQAVIAAGVQHGAAIPFVPYPTALARINPNGYVGEVVHREDLKYPQSPMVFQAGLLRRALAKAAERGAVYSSCTELLFHAGIRVAWVEGCDFNVKVTTPNDWQYVQYLAALPACQDRLCVRH
jgi:2-C-methyl-D-erythritol 4-phosphate cytidylyltransferase